MRRLSTFMVNRFTCNPVIISVQAETIPLEETGYFSKTFLSYIKDTKSLASFYAHPPSKLAFKKAINAKPFSSEKREVLNATLKHQYKGVEASEKVFKNIARLNETKTFTITTGHQLNIFTGPLYFLYKIITAINACKELKALYPMYDFVPIYWMASEDHDIEEINHFQSEGKKVSWETDQKGAVGRFDPAGLLEITKTLPLGAAFFESAYSKETLADAVRHYVNHLFGHEGLVVIDADDVALKHLFTRVVKEDLFKHNVEKLVASTTHSLDQLGYKTQVHARPINFFYLEGDTRERIEFDGNDFNVIDTELRFSKEEMHALIEAHPERFSPNVILRPLYQETILPNLAYIGGPSELVYWLQLKPVFDHFHTPFPILMPRNFGLVCSESLKKKWDKTGLKSEDLFLSSDAAFTKWVKQNTGKDILLEKELADLQNLEKQTKKKASAVDSTLAQHLEALYASFYQKILKAEKKLIKAEKRTYEEKKGQIQFVKERLFPQGTLQERKENFLTFYLGDPHFIQKLLDTFDPFNYEMYLLYE